MGSAPSRPHLPHAATTCPPKNREAYLHIRTPCPSSSSGEMKSRCRITTEGRLSGQARGNGVTMRNCTAMEGYDTRSAQEKMDTHAEVCTWCRRARRYHKALDIHAKNPPRFSPGRVRGSCTARCLDNAAKSVGTIQSFARVPIPVQTKVAGFGVYFAYSTNTLFHHCTQGR